MSGPKALEQGWLLDISDALAVADCLIAGTPLFDVGSGSGVPGLVVGILQPNQPICLVEPRTKRVAFMRAAIQALQLKNVRLLRERWPITELREPCQVVSRAVVDPEVWPHLALEGGNQVTAVLRMLAASRPKWMIGDFTLSEAVDYNLGQYGQRRVERWERSRTH